MRHDQCNSVTFKELAVINFYYTASTAPCINGCIHGSSAVLLKISYGSLSVTLGVPDCLSGDLVSLVAWPAKATCMLFGMKTPVPPFAS